METVVADTLLSCATSRMVTLRPLRDEVRKSALLKGEGTGVHHNPPASLRGSLRLLRRDVEIQQLALEAARLDGAEGKPNEHPDRTQYARLRTQVPPQDQAYREPDHRRDEIHDLLLLLADEVPHERS